MSAVVNLQCHRPHRCRPLSALFDGGMGIISVGFERGGMASSLITFAVTGWTTPAQTSSCGEPMCAKSAWMISFFRAGVSPIRCPALKIVKMQPGGVEKLFARDATACRRAWCFA